MTEVLSLPMEVSEATEVLQDTRQTLVIRQHTIISVQVELQQLLRATPLTNKVSPIVLETNGQAATIRVTIIPLVVEAPLQWLTAPEVHQNSEVPHPPSKEHTPLVKRVVETSPSHIHRTFVVNISAVRVKRQQLLPTIPPIRTNG